jgi:hypothetical protein
MQLSYESSKIWGKELVSTLVVGSRLSFADTELL